MKQDTYTMMGSRRTNTRLLGGLATLATLLLVALLAGCGVPGTIHTTSSLPKASAVAPTQTPLPPVAMPQDEAPHHDLTEWWYYTGHLRGTDAQGRAHAYGFELTFFQTLRGSLPPYYAAHYAVSDLTTGQFHYDERAGFEPPSIIPAANSTAGFDLALGGWTMRGLGGHDQLSASTANYSFQLALTDRLSHPILHNGNGLISYGTSGFSYYYSRPLMAVTGVMMDHGAPTQVTGQAWMDHQWGNFVSLAGSGWDWYSIQLANHTEYMLYIIRDAQKRPVSTFGTAIAPDGSASDIPPQQIQSQATGAWTSPVTGGVYPSGWTVTLPSQQVILTLTPLLRDQELVTTRSTGVAYWEGAVGVTGTAAGKPVTGEAYVELTGYANVPSSSQSSATP